MKKILLSWIGRTDLEEISVTEGTGKGGPIASLLSHPLGQHFQEAHLLSSIYDETQVLGYLSQLRKIVQIPIIHHRCEIIHPMDHLSIHEEVKKVIAEIESNGLVNRYAFHLSPGTNAMAAIWVLFGRSQYPGEFYRTWITEDDELEVTKVDIPFQVTMDAIPAAIRESSDFLVSRWNDSPAFAAILGNSAEIIEAKSKAARVSGFDVPVLILGESGTGKEMLAQAIHTASPRKKGPFLAINCAAIPENLAEAELFGYKKGAFSDAYRDKKGAFANCEQGTLFLDEVGDLSPGIQTKLLRVLQEKKFLPLGGQTEESCDVRIITATNRPIKTLLKSGGFRQDLFHRLAVAVICLPPFRERRDDIEPITNHLVQMINKDFSENTPPQLRYTNKNLSLDAIRWIKEQPWPGNIRELGNLLRRCLLWTEHEVITSTDLRSHHFDLQEEEQEDVQLPEEGFSLDDHLFRIEKQFVLKALKQGGSKAKAAELLGLNQKTLISRLRSKPFL